MNQLDISYYATVINRWVDELIFPTYPAGLYEPIKYMLSGGGKRLRPTLLCASAVAWNMNVDEVKNQALAIEMFHNFTLLHDDVMDNADVRHGKPTVHQKWNESTAILSGDTMLTLATQLVSGCDARFMPQVLGLFNKTAIEIYEGQQLDMNFESRQDVTEDEYLEMIRLKTAVLLGCSCKMGVMLAGGDKAQQDAMYEFGINMGLAFQLRDDYLDTFGDSKVFGKAIGGDILNDKKTLLRIMANNLEPMRLTACSELKGQGKVDSVIRLYKELELDSKCMNLVKTFTRRAIDRIDAIEMPRHEFKQSFKDMALKAISRNS